MLGLERALELLVLDDGVDAELALVAMIGVLQSALAALEQPARVPVHPAGSRAEHKLHAEVARAACRSATRATR